MQESRKFFLNKVASKLSVIEENESEDKDDDYRSQRVLMEKDISQLVE